MCPENHEKRIQSPIKARKEPVMVKIDLSEYEVKDLWSIVGDIDRLKESDNKDFWMKVGAGVRREIDKRMSADYEG